MNTGILDTFELYKGKNFSDICKEVVTNQNNKKNQLDILVDDLKLLIKTPNDAMVLVPLIKDYLEVAVKNDEQLIKLLGVVQRLFSKSPDGEQSSNDFNVKLSPAEIQQLTNEVNNISNFVKEDVGETVKSIKVKKTG